MKGKILGFVLCSILTTLPNISQAGEVDIIRGTFDYGGSAAGSTGVYPYFGKSLVFSNNSEEAGILQRGCSERFTMCEVRYSIDPLFNKITIHSAQQIKYEQ